MYPEHDSKADQFDDAYERRRTGDEDHVDDQDIRELVNLAARLERELPEDLPDPAFRESLRKHLLDQIAGQEPVDLAQERWHRRFLVSPWRVGAAAASLAAAVVVVVLLGIGALGSGSDDDDTVEELSFQAIDSDDDQTLDGEDQFNGASLDDALFTDGDDWVAASFPPFTVEHIVLPPQETGFGNAYVGSGPEVIVNQSSSLLETANMPDQSPVYYFSAPPDPETMLTTLRGALNVDGEVVADEENGVHRVVSDDDETIMLWDPSAAFFQFNGFALEEPIIEIADVDAEPDEIAYRFLELIGFDVYTIQYRPEVNQSEEGTDVYLVPMDLPHTALNVSLGGRVTISDDGRIHQVELHWLSLIEMREVPVRTAEELAGDLQADNGFLPPVESDNDEVHIQVENVELVHVLTRQNDSAFILQPAIKLAGEYMEGVESVLAGPGRYLLPAVVNED